VIKSLGKNLGMQGNCLSYRGYIGSVEFSGEDAVFYGKVAGVKSLISFEGDSVSAITEDFHNAVDEYLEFCEASGEEPEKPFKGSFNVRVGADLHRQAALAASARGISMNALVESAIRQAVSGSIS
jgi:predicted HicB family RNase H-like nuclease